MLDVTLAAADAALGTLCALTLRMRRDGDGVDSPGPDGFPRCCG